MNILKSFRYAWLVGPAVLLIAPLANAGEHSHPPAIVVRYCSGCHGINGNSQLPYIPRLAGQSASYTERKIASFKAGTASPVDEAFKRIVHAGVREDHGFTAEANVHMVGTAHALSDRDVATAADWYASQKTAPGKGGKSEAMERGKDLFVNGVQGQRVPACQTCHGSEAQGTDVAPRLAGQNATYVLGQLALFRSGHRAKSPMTEIARSLETDQARAVASYLQSH